MPRRTPVRPTDNELAVLRVLWDHGPCPVREIHEVLSRGKSVGYTTVLKTLQIMVHKRLVVRDVRGRAHVYAPAAPRPQTLKRLVDDLVDRAFGGAVAQLVVQALGGRTASPDEIRELRRLLDGLEAQVARERSP
jgi:BlaI family penicillinase repressor